MWIGIGILVLLMLIPNVVSAKHEITINVVENGGFESDFAGWTTGTINSISTGTPYEGTKYARSAYDGSNPNNNYIYQNVDFTYLDTLSFAYYTSHGSWYARAYIGGVEKFTGLNTSWEVVEIDVSAINGINQLKFGHTVGQSTYYDAIYGLITVDLEEIRNPSFEKVVSYDTNLLIQWSAWTDVDVNGSHSESAIQSSDAFYQGVNSLKLNVSVDGTGTTMAGVTQQIDLSSTTPYLNFRMYSENGGQGDAYIVVAVEGTPVWQYSGATVWDEFSAPISGYSGTKEVSIYAVATGASASNITAYIDLLSFGSIQEVVLDGKVYDAVTGGVLSGVTVNCSQMGGIITDTSDSMGNYEITGLFTNYDIYLDAYKTDYNHHQTYMHFSTGGTKTINIYMLPYTEHGLYGLVIDHNGEAVPQATVDVWNNTWSNTTNANDYGYFVFKNLSGLYELQASKAGMQGSSIETITMEDLITTLDNCEAVVGWNSSGSVATNSTLKKQGSYSVRCNDTDALLCNKTFSPAKNTNLTYGKLQFWAYIENSSAISTLEVLLIDSSTDYRKWTGLSGTNGWNYFELWIPDASGTANLSDIVKFEVNATGSGEIIILFDEIRAFEPATDFVFLTLYGFFTLTISAKNIDTAESIMSFTATLDGMSTEGTTMGVATFTQVVGGLHTVYVSAEGYYGGVGSPYVWHDMTYCVYLLSTGEEHINITGGMGTQYAPPHLVRFFVQDIYANPKKNVAVTTTCVQTSMGTWSWLYDIFGFKNETQLENTTMNGTTDSAGSISFLMVETIKYNIHFKNTSQSINENLTIYPKSERYTVIVGRTGFFDVEPQLFGDEIDWNFTMEKINTTAAWLNFSYNDTLSQTTSGSYYVYMVNETTGLEKINTSNVTYFCSTPVNIDSSVWSYNCIVYDYRGNTYILGFNATHTTAGEFKEAVSVFFRYNHPLIEFEGWTEGYYQFLSIALLIFLSMLFTGVTIKMGCVILPLSAWGLYGIGWFSPTSDLVTSAILLGIATAIGIGVYMTTTGREKNLAS